MDAGGGAVNSAAVSAETCPWPVAVLGTRTVVNSNEIEAGKLPAAEARTREFGKRRTLT